MTGQEIDWLNTITFNEKRGRIEMMGMRSTVLSSSAFRSYREAIADVIGVGGADTVMYLAGKKYATEYVGGAVRSSLMAGFARRFSWGRNKIMEKAASMLTGYGYGNARVEKIDFGGESVVTLRNSCIASFYKTKQKKPVCAHIAGVIAGGAEAITGKPYQVIETHCTAMGDKECRFVVTREKN